MDSEDQCSTLSESNLKTTQSPCSSNFGNNEPVTQETPSINSEGPNSPKTYKCSECGSTFFRLQHLQDHLNRHSGDRKYQCKEKGCSKAYFAWKHLRKHLIASHRLDNVKKSSYVKREPEETGGKRHKCSYESCNAAYDRRWKLTSHMCKHTGEKLHPCTEIGCDKAYTTIGHLRRHISKSHKPNKNMIITEYSCPEVGCEKVYRTVESVRRHYMIHHNKDRPKGPPFKCTSCDRNFTTPELLGRHKCASYKCEECNLKFINVTAWKNHSKIHRIYKCSELGCSKVFPQFSLLKEHKKVEHKKSLFCQTCDKKLGSRASLREHQQTHLLPEEKKLFSCPYNECSRFYTRKFNLDQHIRSSHEDIKFQCTVPGCEKRLVTKQKLQEHMKLHDPFREPIQRKHIARNQRKDAGKPKRSMAVKLSGVSIPYTEEKNILHSGLSRQISTLHTNEECIESSEASDEWSELSENNWSDLSDELNEHSDASDECDEAFEGMIDCESHLLLSKYREILGRMGGALGSITQSCSNSSGDLTSSPLELVKKGKHVDQISSVGKGKE